MDRRRLHGRIFAALQLPQRRADGGGDDAADLPRVTETDFPFRRMDVDVHAVRRQIDVEDGAWIAAFDDERVIGVADGEENRVRGGGPAVDDGPLVAAGDACEARLADEAADGDAVLLVVDGQHRLVDVLSKQHEDAGAKVVRGGGADDFAVVQNKREGDVRPRKCQLQNHFLYVAVLRVRPFEELPPRGEVAEEMGDLDVRARGAAAVLHVADGAVVHDDFRPDVVLLPPRLQDEP